MKQPVALLVALGWIAAFALAGPSPAEAAPLSGLVPGPGPVLAGGVVIQVGLPALPPPPPPMVVVVRPRVRWVWRTERVWVPSEVVGYDAHGHAIERVGYWTERRVRVRVRRRRRGRVVYRRPRPGAPLGPGGFG
ncbi:MAG: hypothetical protein ACC662_07980, partial [Planctomycetota bacterium]